MRFEQVYARRCSLRMFPLKRHKVSTILLAKSCLEFECTDWYVHDLDCVENGGDAVQTERLWRIRVIVDITVSHAKTNGSEKKALMILMTTASPKYNFVPTIMRHEPYEQLEVISRGTFWTDPFESTSLRVRFSMAFKRSRNTGLLEKVCQIICFEPRTDFPTTTTKKKTNNNKQKQTTNDNKQQQTTNNQQQTTNNQQPTTTTTTTKTNNKQQKTTWTAQFSWFRIQIQHFLFPSFRIEKKTQEFHQVKFIRSFGPAPQSPSPPAAPPLAAPPAAPVTMEVSDSGAHVMPSEGESSDSPGDGWRGRRNARRNSWMAGWLKWWNRLMVGDGWKFLEYEQEAMIVHAWRNITGSFKVFLLPSPQLYTDWDDGTRPYWIVQFNKQKHCCSFPLLNSAGKHSFHFVSFWYAW